MGYGAKEDAKYKADGIMRLLVILAAVGGGCIIFDNLVLNPVLLFRSGTAFAAFYAVQYGSRIAGALLLFVPLLLYMKGSFITSNGIIWRKKQAILKNESEER